MFRLINMILLSISFISCQTTTRSVQAGLFSNVKKSLGQVLGSMDVNIKGPIQYGVRKNQAFHLSIDDAISTDLYLPNIRDSSPLVIFSHGNASYKEAHRIQAEHLASWGYHVLVLQLPHKKQWLENGERVTNLVNMLNANKGFISKRVKVDQVVLVGHSFGGSAMSIAAAKIYNIKGLILLDPAVVDDKVRMYLAEISAPTILLGADPKRFISKKRSWFSKYIQSPFVELTVRGSTHNDAQYPSLDDMKLLRVNSTTQKVKQELFLKGIVSSVHLLTNNLDISMLRKYMDKNTKFNVVRTNNITPRISKNY